MIGWIGSICFALCGLPQAYKAYKEGHSNGLSYGFLILWTVGEVFTLWAILKDSPILYLIFNYLSNLVFLVIMWKYKIKPRTVLK